MNPRLLAENTDVLALRFPNVAKRVRTAGPSSRVVQVVARTGATVLSLASERGRVLLNSKYDPRREAKRRVGEIESTETAIIVGMDGYLLTELVAARFRRIVVIEPDPCILAAFLASMQLTEVLSDPRVVLSIDIENLEAWIREVYLPSFHGDAEVIWSNARLRTDRSALAVVGQKISSAIEATANDVATQAAHGGLWTRNIIFGLARSKQVTHEFRSAHSAAVFAAGPTAESGVSLFRRRPAPLVVAVDTALPVLYRNGIGVDYVVSIDAQAIGYLHRLPGVDPQTTTVCDIGSPSFGERSCLRFVGNHPLGRTLNDLGLNLPVWDTSGGSVTQSALDFCRLLGVREVQLFGADFAYSGGAAYAKGAYVYDVFRGRESRLRSADSQAAQFVLDRCSYDDGRYYSPLLARYREEFDGYCRRYGLERKDDSTLVLPPTSQGAKIERYELDRRRVAESFGRYREIIGSIEAPLSSGSPSLPVATLLPFATSLRRVDSGLSVDGAILLARERTLNYVRSAERIIGGKR